MNIDQNIKTKIAFVLFQTNLQADGGVRSAQILIKHFTRVAPIIVTQRESALTQDLNNLGYEVIIRPIVRRPGQSLFANGIFWGLIDLVRIVSNNFWFFFYLLRQNIKVVHCNDILSFLYFGFGAKLARSKIIFVLRRSFEVRRSYSRKYIFAFKLSDIIVTLSKAMKRELLSRIGSIKGIGDKIKSVYSGVDREQWYFIDDEEKTVLRKSFNLDSSFYIAYVGAFSPRKGQLEFLKKTCLPLIKKHSNLRFIFVGDFSPTVSRYSLECLNFVEDHKLEPFVSFIGGVTNVANWYRVVDLVVLASSSEGLARAMIESLCLGTPVVSFDVSSAKEILEEYQCGLVVDSGDYSGLINAIERIATRVEFRKELSNNALKRVGDLFDANKCAQKFEDLYVL